MDIMVRGLIFTCPDCGEDLVDLPLLTAGNTDGKITRAYCVSCKKFMCKKRGFEKFGIYRMKFDSDTK